MMSESLLISRAEKMSKSKRKSKAPNRVNKALSAFRVADDASIQQENKVTLAIDCYDIAIQSTEDYVCSKAEQALDIAREQADCAHTKRAEALKKLQGVVDSRS